MSAGKKFVAEFLGTFGLILFGAGAILQQQMTQTVGTTGIAVAHGLAILVGIYALGHISGGHFNPAVTMGFFATRRLSAGMTLLYWAAQLAGGIVAAWVLALAYHAAPAEAHLGAPAVDPSIRPSVAAFLEGLAAFMLVLVVFGSAVDPRSPKGFAGLAIGLTVTANILTFGVLTGMAFNPARAFGPALVAGFWQDQWVYWVGPLVGGAVAGILYDRLLLERA
ncbi:MAG: MIP/aquaporin family protein [Bacteroidota bacterium]